MKSIRIFFLRLLVSWWAIPAVVIVTMSLASLIFGWEAGKELSSTMAYTLWYGEA